MCLLTVGRELCEIGPFGGVYTPQIPYMTFSATSRALAIAAIAALSNCNATSQGFSTATFERTPCFGTCPVYRVSVKANGNGNGNGIVTFEGIRNVDSVGTYTSQIDAAAISKLAKAIEDAKYFSLQPSYGQANCPHYGADSQRILTSVTTPEKNKSIDHDLGCGADAPAALADLYKKFDDIIGTSRWIGKR